MNVRVLDQFHATKKYLGPKTSLHIISKHEQSIIITQLTDQDCFAIVPPFPLNQGETSDIIFLQALKVMLFGHPELLFP